MFNRLEFLVDDKVRAQAEAYELVNPIKERFADLLVNYGEEEHLTVKQQLLFRLPMLIFDLDIRNLFKSSSSWKLVVDGIRWHEHGASRTIVTIATSPLQEHADDPRRGTINVSVKESGEKIGYQLSQDPVNSIRTLTDSESGKETSGWGSISELDDEFFEWIEQNLAQGENSQ